MFALQPIFKIFDTLTVETQSLPPVPLVIALAMCVTAFLFVLIFWRRTANRGRAARNRVADLEQELAKVTASLESEIKWRLASERAAVQQLNTQNLLSNTPG